MAGLIRSHRAAAGFLFAPQFPAVLPRTQQEAWFAQATIHTLSSGEPLALPDGGVMVLALGRLRSEGAGASMTLSAPSPVRLPPGTTVTAIGKAHFAQLPAEPPSAATQ